MDPYACTWRARPANLAVPCCVCQKLTPYDPTQEYPRCTGCQARNMGWAYAGNGIATAQDTEHVYQQAGSSTITSESQHDWTSYNAIQNESNGYNVAQNAEHGYHCPQVMDYGHHTNGLYADPMGGMMHNTKRKSDTPPETNGHSNKRMFLNNAYYDDDPFRHYEATRELTQTHGPSPARDGGEDFIDAAATQEQYGPSDPATAKWYDHNGTSLTGLGGVEEEKESQEGEEEDDPSMLSDVQDTVMSSAESQSSELDLFASGGFSDEVNKDEDTDTDTDNDDENVNDDASVREVSAKAVARVPKPAVQHAPVAKAKQMRTPASTRPNSQGSTGSNPKNIAQYCTNLTYLEDFYRRAIRYIPCLPLANHRFWIGVLDVGNPAKSFADEKHFTWMKGNKFTTVETVWHMYQNSTATDEFVLLLGMEKPLFTDTMQELDYFNANKVMFRAVGQKHVDAGGRAPCHDLLPVEREVIEID